MSGGAGDAPAPKASGWLSAKRELRSSRKGLRAAGEETAERRFERWDTAYSPRVPRGEAFVRHRRTPLNLHITIGQRELRRAIGRRKKSRLKG